MALAYSILRNREDAEDAVQDAFVAGFRHLRGFEGRSALTTWFTRIVMNASLMILRKRKSSRLEIIPDAHAEEHESWQERIPAARPDPEALCAESETIQLVDRLLGKMSPRLRNAFALRHYKETSVQDGAAALGIAPVTFKSRVLRARRLLSSRTSYDLIAPLRNPGVRHPPMESA